jgi:CDP-glucose 4,6-dehydratase
MIAAAADAFGAVYARRRVLVTGHTGFKGAWLTLWLSELGAEVTGYALPPEGERWFFVAAGVERRCRHHLADVRDPQRLKEVVIDANPDAVFHLAAQPLVRRSYEDPLETMAVNVMGTAHLLEAVRARAKPCSVVIVTSDKCYENREWEHGYRETDRVGGHDVYSTSKGAAELVVSAWRRSFFPPARLEDHGIRVATARAGNAIGGGDWASDRIVPDCIRALMDGRAIPVRNPTSTRPWQHVLDPLSGYLKLGARLLGNDPAPYGEAWNFGPEPASRRTVRELVEALLAQWGSGSWEDRSDPGAPHEAALLQLAIDKARARLGWAPKWSFAEAIRHTVGWYRAQHERRPARELEALALQQIRAYGEAETR